MQNKKKSKTDNLCCVCNISNLIKISGICITSLLLCWDESNNLFVHTLSRDAMLQQQDKLSSHSENLKRNSFHINVNGKSIGMKNNSTSQHISNNKSPTNLSFSGSGSATCILINVYSCGATP